MFNVFSHHKCGTVALLDYLAEFASINRLTIHASHRGDELPLKDIQINFRSNAVYSHMAKHIDRASLHLIRNPLDIVQSAYFSHRFSHSTEGWPRLQRQRELLAGISKEEGMMKTVLFCMDPNFYEQTPGPLLALKEWDFDDERFLNARVEDYFDKFTKAFKRDLDLDREGLLWPDENRFSFREMSKSYDIHNQNEIPHFRSGQPKAWRTELPMEVVQFVRTEFSNLLARFYPEDL